MLQLCRLLVEVELVMKAGKAKDTMQLSDSSPWRFPIQLLPASNRHHVIAACYLREAMQGKLHQPCAAT